ncbi:5'-methylthioadenosine/adenosylhomocysteine nucleosidase [Lentilactobacillus senioris]|nr:5'-methylthioadenosine/adenosylhomocysteine nucleosidase [Lentilactobacillus senioris]
MTYGIICAMDEEIAILKANLKNEATTKIGPIEFFKGQIANSDVVLVKSGIGKVQAGITAALMLTNFKIDYLVNTGSAGGIGTDLKIGDVVISTETAYHDVDVTAAGYEIGQLPNCPARFPASRDLEAQITKAAEAANLETHSGLIVSGDQFVASKEVIDHIKDNFSDALCVEMEGAAIGQVAYDFDVPYVVIRAMSDVGDEDANTNFDEFIIEAGKRSAEMMMNVFQSN